MKAYSGVLSMMGKLRQIKALGKEASTELDDNQNVESQRETSYLQLLRLFNFPVNTEASLCANFTVPEKNMFNILSTFHRAFLRHCLGP